MKLYEISDDIRQCMDAMQAAEDDDVRAAYIATLDGIEAEFDDKAEQIAAYIKELRAEVEALKAVEKSTAERRKAKENAAERMTAYLLNQMAAVGKKKIDRPFAKVSYSEGRESLQISNEGAVVEYLKRSCMYDMLTFADPKPNKTAITAYIKDGGSVMGAEMVRKPFVTIK